MPLLPWPAAFFTGSLRKERIHRRYVLGKVHAHLFLLGMMVFLLTALFAERYDLESRRISASLCVCII